MIVRQKRSKNFTVIANDLLNDSRLDWKELGLLVYLLSKPDDWCVSAAHLAKQRKTGRDGILVSLKKLREAGYVHFQRKVTGGGDYVVFDEPRETLVGVERPQDTAGDVDTQPQPENPTLGNSPKPSFPTLGNSGRIVNTDKNKQRPEGNSKPAKFDDFWQTYGNKKSKPTAEKAWDKLTPEQQHSALDAIPAFKASLPDWHALPYPASYLNQHRWEDDLTPTKEKTNGTPRNETVSGKPTGAAARVSQRNQRAYQEAIAREQGYPTVREVSGEIYAQVDLCN